MESSTVLAFRIFVMLSCLIIVPMAAIFGSAFPDVVKTVLVDRIVAWSTGNPYEPASAPAQPTGFAEVPPSGGANQAAGGADRWEAPRWPAQNTGAVAGGGGGPQPGGVVAAGTPGAQATAGNQSASFNVAAEPNRGGPASNPLQRVGAEVPYRNVAADNRLGTKPFANPGNLTSVANDPSAASQGVPRPLEQPDRFTIMERKLREYGATYYLLETWGNEGELYRFHCRMAISNNPNYTRQFEGTDRDALKAMAQVLEHVEAWRAGRSQ